MDYEFKIGDKVCGCIGRDKPYGVIKDFEVTEKEVLTQNGKVIKRINVTLEFPGGDTYRTCLSELYPADERVLDINKKTKWAINNLLGNVPNKVKMDNGYFGSYSLIDYKGKQAVVYVDDRDAEVNVKTGFFDKIFYGNEYEVWDGDYRWNHDMPVVVYDKDKGYNIVAAHSFKLLCKEWLKELSKKFRSNRTLGSYLEGVTLDGKEVYVYTNGSIHYKASNSPEQVTALLEEVKKYSNEQVLSQWIKAGKPCAHIYGLEYKGASARTITMEKAEEYFSTHHTFSGMFNSAEWRIINGEVTLLFRDYSNSDYD